MRYGSIDSHKRPSEIEDMLMLPIYKGLCMILWLVMMVSLAEASAQSDRHRFKEQDLLGTWYLVEADGEMEVYTRSESLRPQFSFWKDGSMTYAHCQDPCGCMAAIYYGDWKGGKRKFKVTFDIFEDGLILDPEEAFNDIHMERIIRLLNCDGDTLRIKPYVHYRHGKWN